MATPDRNHELLKKFKFFLKIFFYFLNNLKCVERKAENIFLFTILILTPILLPFVLCCPGQPHHSLHLGCVPARVNLSTRGNVNVTRSVNVKPFESCHNCCNAFPALDKQLAERDKQCSD
jgi:hypothetical protein